MTGAGTNGTKNGKRRAILDLAPLELECLRVLWPLGEATVHAIRDQLAIQRPRAYTTIMTIMDRLAHKGIVARRKSGKAYIYSANLSASQARSQALHQILENFFDGSSEALVDQIRTGDAATAFTPKPLASRPRRERPRRAEQAEREEPSMLPPRLDETLL